MKLTTMFMCFVFVSCTTTPMNNKGKRWWEDFSRIETSRDTKESVQEKLGPPADKSESIDKKLNKKIERWTYNQDNIPKFFAVFVDGTLRSISMNVWEGEKESNLKELLPKFSGNWKVIPDPVTNPHVMPTMCHLVDEDSGKKIEIHGHKMVVEFVSKWVPKMLMNEALPEAKRPKFCIADICAKTSEKVEWETSHCDQLSVWLKQFNEGKPRKN